jgi:hypothetical protein
MKRETGYYWVVRKTPRIKDVNDIAYWDGECFYMLYKTLRRKVSEDSFSYISDKPISSGAWATDRDMEECWDAARSETCVDMGAGTKECDFYYEFDEWIKQRKETK